MRILTFTEPKICEWKKGPEGKGVYVTKYGERDLAEAGLHWGAHLVAINDENVRDLSFEDVSAKFDAAAEEAGYNLSFECYESGVSPYLLKDRGIETPEDVVQFLLGIRRGRGGGSTTLSACSPFYAKTIIDKKIDADKLADVNEKVMQFQWGIMSPTDRDKIFTALGRMRERNEYEMWADAKSISGKKFKKESSGGFFSSVTNTVTSYITGNSQRETAKWEEGDRVEVLYRKNNKWYPGKICSVRKKWSYSRGNTFLYNVVWDDTPNKVIEDKDPREIRTLKAKEVEVSDEDMGDEEQPGEAAAEDASGEADGDAVPAPSTPPGPKPEPAAADRNGAKRSTPPADTQAKESTPKRARSSGPGDDMTGETLPKLDIEDLD